MPRIEGTKVGVDPAGRTHYSPIVLISIAVGGCIARGPAVIDSGADVTMVPAESLIGCGIDFARLPKGQTGQGAGGKFETRPLAALVKYREWEVCDQVSVAPPGALPVVLLGRNDFFRRFTVRFNWHKEPPEVHIDPIVETPRTNPKKRR